MDLPWTTERAADAVWALGALDADGEPTFHAAFPRSRVALDLAAATPTDDCFPFAM